MVIVYVIRAYQDLTENSFLEGSCTTAVPGMRKPKDYPIKERRDIVQLDTLDLRPLPEVVPKHFTAHDVVSNKYIIQFAHIRR